MSDNDNKENTSYWRNLITRTPDCVKLSVIEDPQNQIISVTIKYEAETIAFVNDFYASIREKYKDDEKLCSDLNNLMASGMSLQPNSVIEKRERRNELVDWAMKTLIEILHDRINTNPVQEGEVIKKETPQNNPGITEWVFTEEQANKPVEESVIKYNLGILMRTPKESKTRYKKEAEGTQ